MKTTTNFCRNRLHTFIKFAKTQAIFLYIPTNTFTFADC